MITFFIPQQQVGDFELNTDLSSYLNMYDFNHIPSDDVTEWETHEFNDNISLYVENGKIVSISCREECLYKGRNIIGMQIHEFISYYDLNSDNEPETLYVSDDEIQDVYEFDTIRVTSLV